MKAYIKTTLPAIIFLAFACNKEISDNSRQSSSSGIDNQTLTADCFKNWQGQYANTSNGHLDSINKSKFIKDGVAQLPPSTRFNNYFTGISYTIPSCHYLRGNNIIFEASIKNPPTGVGSVYGHDVALQIQGSRQGSKPFFEVFFAGVPAGQQYDHIRIGNFQVSNLHALIHNFGDFDTVSVHLKENKVQVYLNGVLIKEINYDPVNDLGEIKSIACGFKGTGSIDWVKLYERKTGALLMQEDFNVDGETTAMWFD